MKLCAGITLSSPLVMAPLAGYTDIPFRALVREQGASLVFTELIASEGVVRKNSKTFKLMEISESERPVGIQLFGKDPTHMSEAAVITETLFKPDCIDINCGCSVPKVAGSGSGAGLLRTPELLCEIIRSIVSRVKTPVSVKIRLGWDDASKNYKTLVPMLCDAGVSFITVHGRTRAQKFSGESDWSAIAEISSLSRVPVIGNGDIESHESAQTRLKESGCAAVMIGRKALGNPWIFSGHNPSLSERVHLARRHFLMMTEYYGEYGVILARKHLSHYFHGFSGASSLRAHLVKAPTQQDVIRLFEEFHT